MTQAADATPYGVSLAELLREERRLFWERVYVATIEATRGAYPMGSIGAGIVARDVAGHAERVADFALAKHDLLFGAPIVPKPNSPPPAPEEESPYLGGGS